MAGNSDVLTSTALVNKLQRIRERRRNQSRRIHSVDNNAVGTCDDRDDSPIRIVIEHRDGDCQTRERHGQRERCPSWCHDCLGRGCMKQIANCDRGWPLPPPPVPMPIPVCFVPVPCNVQCLPQCLPPPCACLLHCVPQCPSVPMLPPGYGATCEQSCGAAYGAPCGPVY